MDVWNEKICSLKTRTGGRKLEESKPERGRDFDRLLVEAVDEALGVLGEGPKQTVYFWLERNHSVSWGEIPRRLEEFASGLEKIFGFGATYFERQIVERLYSKLNLKHMEERGFSFVDYVREAERKYGVRS